MNSNEFRRVGKEMIDFVANYLDTIQERPVLPSVEPCYLEKLIPDSAPTNGESFDEIFADIERVIMPGVSTVLKNSNYFNCLAHSRHECPCFKGNFFLP